MLELVNNAVVLEPDLMNYPQFKALWMRDRTPEKDEAFTYISYIWHFYNPRSAYYKGYPEAVRKEKIIEAVFPEHMKNVSLYDDKVFIQAAELYKELLGLSTFRGVLDMAKEVLHEITRTLKDSRVKAGTKLNNLGKLSKAMEEIRKVESMVDDDEINSRVKGSRVVKDRER